MLTPEQLEERRLGIGGSDVGALFGLSPFLTAMDVYLSKVKEMPDKKSAAKDRGNNEEDGILDWYQKHSGILIKKPMYSFVHPEHSFLRANLDGLSIDTQIVIEAKSIIASKRSEWGQEGTNQIPPHYLLQVAHYCLVCDAPEARLIVKWAPLKEEGKEWKGSPYSVYVYKRDERLEKAIIQKAKAFWTNHVLANVPPPVQSLKDCASRWPHAIPGTSIEATDEILSLVENLKELKKQEAEIKEKKKEVDIKIKAFFGDNEALTNNEKVIATLTNTIRLDIDDKKLKSDQPELYKELQATYAKEVSFRTLYLRK